MDCHLIITSQGNRRIPLTDKQYWMIGRGRGNDINLEENMISRRHAMLQILENGEVYLVDFGSRNGSFLNGYRVGARIKLNDGDRLGFGDVSAVFRCSVTLADGSSDGRTMGHTLPMQQRRLLSVLVVDIRDFTVLSRQIGEQRIAELIGTFFHRAGDIIGEHGSRVDKFIGDALMAVWFHEEDAADVTTLRPFKAFCAISAATQDLNREFTLPFPLRIGAGINTGYAMVGNTGSAGRADYTALGDTVNAAFRLESATKDLGCDIAIGELTHERLLTATGASKFAKREIDLKGYGATWVYAGSLQEVQQFLAL